jgi:hypothetical protein
LLFILLRPVEGTGERAGIGLLLFFVVKKINRDRNRVTVIAYRTRHVVTVTV